MGDPYRGTTLEILLTRLIASPTQPQIIGLSATIPNAKEMADWIGAKLVQTDRRDIDLREGVLYTGTDENVQIAGIKVRAGDFVYREYNTGKVDVEHGLHIHTLNGIAEISKTEQSIVFRNTPVNAEKVARTISERLPVINNASGLIEQLDASVEPTPLTRALQDILLNGVAFHHAGLLSEERRIVEQGFRNGLIRVICSTTTLGAGVNTPAKNVIILDYQTYEGKNILTRVYKNMAGRAGRLRTKDNFGRSVLFAENQREANILWNQYIISQPEPVESQLAKGKGLRTSILGLIACGISNSRDDLLNFIEVCFFLMMPSEKRNMLVFPVSRA